MSTFAVDACSSGFVTACEILPGGSGSAHEWVDPSIDPKILQCLACGLPKKYPKFGKPPGVHMLRLAFGRCRDQRDERLHLCIWVHGRGEDAFHAWSRGRAQASQTGRGEARIIVMEKVTTKAIRVITLRMTD